MKHRSKERELMDLGLSHYTRDEYHDCLDKLGMIGNFLGGNRATLKALKTLEPLPTSFVDIGCGNGALVVWLAQRFSKITFVGMDIDPEAIIAARGHTLRDVAPWAPPPDYAQVASTGRQGERLSCSARGEELRSSVSNHLSAKNVSFQHQKDTSLAKLGSCHPELDSGSMPLKFDIVHACLVCHHMTDLELVQFLSDCRLVARRAIIINDLQRSLLSYMLFWLISPLFRNRMIRIDGLISIKRGFRKSELKEYLKQAGYAEHQYTITWRWAFRWVVVVKL